MQSRPISLLTAPPLTHGPGTLRCHLQCGCMTTSYISLTCSRDAVHEWGERHWLLCMRGCGSGVHGIDKYAMYLPPASHSRFDVKVTEALLHVSQICPEKQVGAKYIDNAFVRRRVRGKRACRWKGGELNKKWVKSHKRERNNRGRCAERARHSRHSWAPR